MVFFPSQPSGDMGASDIWKLAGRSVMLIKLLGPTSLHRGKALTPKKYSRKNFIAGAKKTMEIYIIQLKYHLSTLLVAYHDISNHTNSLI